MTTLPFDPTTLSYYARDATHYADAAKALDNAMLPAFLARLAPGARILDLGCGGGRDSAAMIAAGFDVDPTDGVAEMAAEAARRLHCPVRTMRFDELTAVAAYDAVWAHASLLHAPIEALPALLRRIHRALRPGGWHFANFKAGTGGARDHLDRFYNYPDPDGLRAAYALAGPWSDCALVPYEGGTYGGGRVPWIAITVRKPVELPA